MERRGSELAMPQRESTSCENNGDGRKEDGLVLVLERRWGGGKETDTEMVFYNMHESARDRQRRRD